MKLSALDAKNAKPKEKPYKLADGAGLHLLVQPNGNRFWRYRYRYAGVEKMLALGEFPIISLADARRKRDDAKRLLAEGKDPGLERKLEKIASAEAAKNTFGVVAKEYLERLAANGAAEQTLKKNSWLLQDLCKPIARRPIAEITPAEILNLLQHIERSGRRDTARRLRGAIGTVYRHAIVTLRATNDPTYALRGALLRPQVKPRAAMVDEQQFGRLMASIDEYDGWPTIKAALTFVALTCARPG